jgi:thiamine pyrophosphate-dependent acetolactate synthase large subunit-like protein
LPATSKGPGRWPTATAIRRAGVHRDPKRHGAKLIVIVANNAAWNIERLDQEMNYGGRVVGATLAWSDYAAMTCAFGLHGDRVTDPARLRVRSSRHSQAPRR